MKIKSKKAKRILLVIIIIIVFILGIIIGNIIAKRKTVTNDVDNSSETTQQVVEVQVGTQTIENTLTSSGEISYSDTEELSLSTSKYFSTMCVETGDIVKEGENILQYTDGTYLTAEYDCIISDYSVPDTSSICTSSNYIEVENIATMTMTLSVSESEINKVSKGQEVEIELTAIEDTTYSGTITSVSSIGSYQTSGTTFTAVIEFENDGNAKPGMSASCTIVLEKAEDCIAVPIDAVQTNDDQKYVVVVDESGNTSNVNIETGISNDSYVQVLSGLEGGETIQMVQITTTNSTTEFNQNGEGKGSGGGMKDMEDMEMPDGSDMQDRGQKMQSDN